MEDEKIEIQTRRFLAEGNGNDRGERQLQKAPTGHIHFFLALRYGFLMQETPGER